MTEVVYACNEEFGLNYCFRHLFIGIFGVDIEKV